MHISKLQISDFRLIESMTLEPCTGINLIYGSNGAGKTSILEAIYLAGRGRSFRHHDSGPIIRFNQSSSRILIRTRNDSTDSESILGVDRGHKHFRYRFNGADLSKRSELLRALPIQLITPHSHLLLEGGPDTRRRFLDHGLFHVEPDFHAWQSAYNRALKQRNAGLKSDSRVAHSWNHLLEEYADKMDCSRKAYLDKLASHTRHILTQFESSIDFCLEYRRGWPESQGLGRFLTERLDSDSRVGYTMYGPHRADILITQNRIPVSKTLSRGQQKILATALLLAQVKLLDVVAGIRPVILIDDLSAELDYSNRSRLAEIITESPYQCFVTAVDASPYGPQEGWRLFHVEHGRCLA